MVAPKRAALAEANRKLESANKKLAGIRSRVRELQDRVTALEEGLMKATADKNAAIAQVGGQSALQPNYSLSPSPSFSSFGQPLLLLLFSDTENLYRF